MIYETRERERVLNKNDSINSSRCFNKGKKSTSIDIFHNDTHTKTTSHTHTGKTKLQPDTSISGHIDEINIYHMIQ